MADDDLSPLRCDARFTLMVKPRPAARSGHVMHFVPAINAVVLHGGLGEPTQYYNDTWILTNDEVWTQLHFDSDRRTPLPPPAFGQASCVLKDGCTLVVHGGLTRREMHLQGGMTVNLAIKGKPLQWSPWGKQFAFGIWGHSLVSIDHKEREMLFGFGGNTSLRSLNECFLLDPVTGAHNPFPTGQFAPPPRRRHTCCKVSPFAVIIFGGRDDVGRTYNDLWAINVVVGVWFPLTADHSFPPQTLRTLVFGNNFHMCRRAAQSIEAQCGQGLSLDIPQAPLPRTGSCMELFEGTLCIFGGFNQEIAAFNDFFAFDLTTFRWEVIPRSCSLPEGQSSPNPLDFGIDHAAPPPVFDPHAPDDVILPSTMCGIARTTGAVCYDAANGVRCCSLAVFGGRTPDVPISAHWSVQLTVPSLTLQDIALRWLSNCPMYHDLSFPIPIGLRHKVTG